MSDFQFRTRGQQSPQGKQRVYFTSHPDDFALFFEEIQKEILDRQDCAVFYLEPGTQPEDVEDYDLRLREMQLFVVPVTTKLLTKENRAMDVDVPFAFEHHIPVLPLMQESGLDDVFNKKFGDLQYLYKYDADPTAIPYEEKLTKYLESVIVGDEQAKKVRAGMVQKQKKGFVMIPPLGYFKDKNTNQVVVVEEHAQIVRRIFDMYLEGYGFSAIARIFNEKGIKSPAYYQKQLLGKSLGYNKPKIGLKYLWDNTGVKRILQNEFYIGTLTCHKTYNNKITHIRKDVPKEEQYVHENFVTPIISREKFELVQKMIEQKKKGNVRASAGQPFHRYAGLLECGDCGLTFVAIKRKWRDKPLRIEYACNGYHRYGKENCSAHRINESEIDELVYNEILNIREQAKENYKNIDNDVRRWLKQKSTVTGKIKQLNADLKQRKSDQKEILLERIRDKEHAEVYDEMLTACENDIKKIFQELYDIQNYSETIKKRKSEMKQTVDLIEEIVKEGQISNANLRQLIDKIIIYEDVEGLRIQINLNAAFTEHMTIFGDKGNELADLQVINNKYPLPMKRRIKFDK